MCFHQRGLNQICTKNLRLAEVRLTRPTLLFVSASWCNGRMLDSCSEGGRSTRPLAQEGVVWYRTPLSLEIQIGDPGPLGPPAQTSNSEQGLDQPRPTPALKPSGPSGAEGDPMKNWASRLWARGSARLGPPYPHRPWSR